MNTFLGRPAADAQGGTVPEWRPGGDFMVGVEDELLMVDDDGQLLGLAAANVLASLPQKASSATIKPEIFLDEVELGTPVCSDAQELVSALAALREEVGMAAALMGVGVHPSAAFGTAHTTSSPRYDRLVMEFAGLFRTPTAGFQVHVGLPDPDTAMLVYRGLRNRLPLLRALAAGSPYWHARDSGLACARSAILRSYPRTTLPPVLCGWEQYVETMQRQMWAAGVPDYSYVCWELRPQPRLGTVEVRVMDAQHSLARVAGLTALVQGLARYAVEVPDRTDLPEDTLLANDHAACRYGLDARIVDGMGSRRPLREVAREALVEAHRMLSPQGRAGPLEIDESMLDGQPEYTRQRRYFQEHGMSALLGDLVSRTMRVDI